VRHEVPRVALILVLSVGMLLEVSVIGQTQEQAGNTKQITPATGPLRVSRLNPRYFSDESGRPIYLTGSHSGPELQDNAWGDDEGGAFNYASFLDLLVSYNLNFIRMWVVETTRLHDRQRALATPMPYQRTGPGRALDGDLKFDLGKFNPAYFDRLRARVMAARDRGIYVMVMLFQGFSIEMKGGLKQNPWIGHPFHFANNVNGINGDADSNGEGQEVHTLKIPSVTRLQEAYVTRVIDTINDLDNVLYEISNESHNQSTSWQYHMIRYIQDYEKRKPKQHPVVMSVQHPKGDNSVLFKSPAAAISPNPYPDWGYRDNPPAADGSKIIIADTDHLFGMENINHKWVWKSFLRGLNPILLDHGANPGKPEIPKWQLIRRSLGYARRYAQRIDLATMVPRDDLASTGYCLAHPGVAYLVYLPSGGSVTVDLRAATRTMRVEWFSPTTGETIDGETIMGGTGIEFNEPFGRGWIQRGIHKVLRVFKVDKPTPSNDAVLYLASEKTMAQP
jgi:hypothetical protein